VLRIAEHFLRQFSERQGKQFSGFSSDAAASIARYPWPGNVRQLQNAMQQVVVLNDCAGDTLVTEQMLPEPITSGSLETETEAQVVGIAPSAPRLSAVSTPAHLVRRQQIEPLWLTEKNAVEAAIDACDGNINRAAGLLEVAPSTLYRKLQSWKASQA
jgi:two-component system repressor protein LuxO